MVRETEGKGWRGRLVPASKRVMEYRHLRYFIAVAEELNVTQAVVRLHTVQPSLSRQIRQLEEMVGAPLSVRAKRRLRLTGSRPRFSEQAREILQTTDRALKLARKAARARRAISRLALSERGDQGLCPHSAILLEKYPDIHLALRSLSEPALVASSARPHHRCSVYDRSHSGSGVWLRRSILRQKIMVVVPAAHPLAKLKRIPWQGSGNCGWLGLRQPPCPPCRG